MNFKKSGPFIFILLLLIIALWLKRANNEGENTPAENSTNADKRGLNRYPAEIHYSKHANCRMECRKVSKTEVEETLHNGKINYTKSDLKGDACHKKYAVEMYSRDKQHLRIIFAPCQNDVTVVTVIDLDTDWECSCN